MKEIVKDIEEAKNIIARDLLIDKDTDYEFKEHCKLYDFTTENNGYYNYMNKNMQTLLTVTGSGDSIINSLLHGVKSVTTFDINQLAYYNMMLKIYMVKLLSYGEFLKYYFAYQNNKYLDKEIFTEVMDYLPEDIKEFWSSLYKDFSSQEIANGLYRNCKDDKNNSIRNMEESMMLNEYLSNRNYNYAKRRISNLKVNFIQGDIEQVPLSLKRKFDAINLSNVQEFYYKNPSEYRTLLEERYFPLLKEHASIMFAYIYRNSIEQLKFLSENTDKFNYDRIDLLKEINNYDDKELAQNSLNKSNIRKYNFIKTFEDLHPEKILLSEAGYGLGHGDKDMSLIYYKKTK